LSLLLVTFLVYKNLIMKNSPCINVSKTLIQGQNNCLKLFKIINIFIFIYCISCIIFMQNYCDAKENDLEIFQESAMYPSLHKNLLVWGESENDVHRIHLYNLKNNHQKIIKEIGYTAIYPVVYDKKLIWLNASENYSLYITDLDTYESRKIVDGMVLQPCIKKDIVVWIDYRHNHSQIYYYDLRNKIERKLTSVNINARQPTTNGKFIAWIENCNNFFKLCLFDITKDKFFYIKNSKYFVNSPWLSESYLTWIEYSDKKYRICIYDLSKNKKKEVVLSDNLICQLRSSDDFLVWESWTLEGSKVMAMKINGGKIFPVGNKNIQSSWLPDIDKSNVAMVANFSKGYEGIYYTNILKQNIN